MPDNNEPQPGERGYADVSYHWGPINRAEWRFERPGGSSHSSGCVEIGEWIGDGTLRAGDAPWCGLVAISDSHSPDVVSLVPRYDFGIFIQAAKAGQYDRFLTPQPAPPPLAPPLA